MESRIFRFEKRAAYLEVAEDVLNRPAFRIFSWLGTPDESKDYHHSAGWWHLTSGVVDFNSMSIFLYDDVTAMGYSDRSCHPISEESVEELGESDLQAQANLILSKLLALENESFHELAQPDEVEGSDSAEFQQILKNK